MKYIIDFLNVFLLVCISCDFLILKGELGNANIMQGVLMMIFLSSFSQGVLHG